ncbi:flagellar basal-body rod protein FlgF [Massilia aquatica]|uniref:Flagellar basal-body rod protein FlgF n=1 Tax=Massilia aquatica TaxID=2609000 RepID=A0ABX0MK85_9BURK|nr:flagellar basal-body rod protein FlgF [Massilia aquatica]NHZ42591.1 flagellar basal-body rod protein FlgF [Massilia aquatica]
MLKSINIGTSGLIGFSKELETISNNVANLNTPGFKGANSQFAALFSAGGNSAGAGAGKTGTHSGSGLGTLPTMVDFTQGPINQTTSDLDVAIDGNGFFVLHDAAGNTSYTRDGRFNFNNDGILTNAAGDKVQQLSAEGALKDITLEGSRINAALPSTSIKLGGSLSLAESPKVVSGINVIDSVGANRALSVEFKNNGAVTAGSWLVTIKDGTTTVGSGEVRFIDGKLDPARSTVSFNYAPADAAKMPMTLTLNAGMTVLPAGLANISTPTVDGYGQGALSKVTFDKAGKMVINYSNGQTSSGQQLALAQVNTATDLDQVGGNTFKSTNSQAVKLGVAGEDGSAISAKSVEGSNVDLSKAFSAIIVTQRGYQASSELISTANEMLDTLMRMKG